MMREPVATLPVSDTMLTPACSAMAAPTGETVGAAIAEHAGVNMVSLTGNVATGSRIMMQAAPTLKRVHLELGGKAPFIVFDDADLEAAVQGAVVGGYINTGQDCTAATRVYVQQPRYEEFLERFKDAVEKIRTGDPTQMTTCLLYTSDAA